VTAAPPELNTLVGRAPPSHQPAARQDPRWSCAGSAADRRRAQATIEQLEERIATIQTM
jgi:hypothetical protein